MSPPIADDSHWTSNLQSSVSLQVVVLQSLATQEDNDDFERATKLSEITDTSQVDSIPLGM